MSYELGVDISAVAESGMMLYECYCTVLKKTWDDHLKTYSELKTLSSTVNSIFMYSIKHYT